MSNRYSSLGHQNNAYMSGYVPETHQYTNTPIHQYYQQDQVYPPQSYHAISDPYPHIHGYGRGPAGMMQGPTSQEHMITDITQEKRTYKCDLPDCTNNANFTRLADLQRHQATVHKASGPPDHPCSVPECTRIGDKGFTRRDHLVEHLRNFHQIDIPKRKPGERSAYRPDLFAFGST